MIEPDLTFWQKIIALPVGSANNNSKYMHRLKDKFKREWPPGGYVYRQDQTKWVSSKGSDFNSTVAQIIAHRKANPGITNQYNLATDKEAVALELECSICARLGNNPAYCLNDSAPSPFLQSHSQQKSTAAAAVGSARKAVAGVKTVLDWLGSGLRPAKQEVANARAAVCAECPNNKEGNFWQKLDAAAAGQIKLLVELKNDLKLTTPLDDKLKTCDVCDCLLKLKVWCQTDVILANTSDDVLQALDKNCWILSEKNACNSKAVG